MTNTTLPNGYVITEVPEGTTREELREESIAQGWATKEEWQEWTPELTPTSEKIMGVVSDVGDFMSGNAEIPMGVGGAVAGALTGSLAGPVGTVVGGIVGGALGSGGGSLLSDHLEGGDLDYSTAMNEVLISAGIDIATLGTGKLLKPIVAYVKSKRATGMSPQEAADMWINNAKEVGASAGSAESLRATQKFLSANGATLTPVQTGNATGAQIIGQKFAEAGMLSSGKMADNAKIVDDAVNSAFDDLLNKSGSLEGLDAETLGATVHGIIVEGKKALSNTYGNGLDDIVLKLKGKGAPVAPLRTALEGFVTKHDAHVVTSLDPAAKSVINEFLKGMGDINVTSAKNILAFEKTFKQRMSALGDVNSAEFNGTAARQLGELSGDINTAVQKVLRSVDAPAADAYKALNKSYAEGINGLLPTITKGSMTTANKGDFKAIGNILLQEGSTDATRAMYKSVDEAFKQLDGKTLNYGSAKEVKDTIRNGFLLSLMPKIGTESFSISAYKGLSRRFSTPKQKARLAVVMGDNYKGVQQLLNVMEEASVVPASNIGELALKAKEYAGIATLATTVGGGFVGGWAGAGAAVGMASAVFTIPSFLAKAALNPKAVNRIMSFHKTNFKGKEQAMLLAASNLVADVMRELSAEDQKEIMDDVQRAMDPDANL